MDGHLYERECDVDGRDGSLAQIVPEEIAVERTVRSHHGLFDRGLLESTALEDLWRMAA